MKKNKLIISSLIATSIVAPIQSNIGYASEEVEIKNIDYRIITGNAVNFRKGAGTNHASMGKFYKGDKVEFISQSGSWVNVKYNGKVGFVHSDYVSSTAITPPTDNGDNTIKSTKVVNGNSVNFRKGPSTSYSKIATLSKGTEVGFISESNGWSKISYNGQIGYMASEYLSIKDTNVTPPTGDETVKSTKIVSGNSVNFRKGPGTSYSKISTLSYGTEVGFISQSNGWSKIKYNDKVGYMASEYLQDKSSSNIPSSEKADKVINFGKTLLGKPYVWGAEGPNSFDCSGFTQYVFKKSVGVSIPRVSRDQSKFGQAVSRNNLQKGDLIFFDTDGSNNGYVSHVGIYMGNNEFIHASSSGKKVMISKMSSYYNDAFVNARRVL